MIADPITHMIGDQIGYEATQNRGNSASASCETELQAHEPRSQGWIGSEGKNPPHDSGSVTITVHGGGGELIFRAKGRTVSDVRAMPALTDSAHHMAATPIAAGAPGTPDTVGVGAASTPDTVGVGAASTSDTVGVGAKLLRGIGVRADVAARLDAHPPEQITQLIGQARNRPEVRDVAAWVVSALRVLPIDVVAPAPPPKVSEATILFHPTISGFDRMRWLNRFRNAESADRPAILARFHAEHPPEEGNVPAT
jgi:hypothetical protein